jgi:hypothetical protein
MDIAMLGISNAGKTTFVTAMYGEMSKATGPFSVIAQRQADHQWLTRNAMELIRGNYPAPSDHRSVYGFTLRYEKAPFLDFVWRDYRGGALTELSDESADAGQLRADLARADGVVILIDSTHLLDRVRAKTKLRPVIAAAVRVLTQRTTMTPVVIALTKWDLVSGREGQVESVAADVLGDLLVALRDSEHVHGCMVPIACGPESVNIELPVLWCIHIGVLEHFYTVAWEAQVSEQRAAQAFGQRGVLKDFGKWMSGSLTATQEGRIHMREAALRRAYLEPIVEPAERLGAIFTDVLTF